METVKLFAKELWKHLAVAPELDGTFTNIDAEITISEAPTGSECYFHLTDKHDKNGKPARKVYRVSVMMIENSTADD